MVTRGRTSAQAFAGCRGRRPLRFAREWAAAGGRPSSGPAGPPSPKGEGKGCCWRQRKVSRNVGDAAPYGLPGKGGSGSLPLIRPCGATFPQGGRQGLLLTAAQASAGRRGRRTLRFARGRAVTGACPSSGPAGPPSPEGEGKGCCWRQRKPPRGIGDAAPCGLPGEGRQREVAAGWGHPALLMGIWKRCGVYVSSRFRAAAR